MILLYKYCGGLHSPVLLFRLIEMFSFHIRIVFLSQYYKLVQMCMCHVHRSTNKLTYLLAYLVTY